MTRARLSVVLLGGLLASLLLAGVVSSFASTSPDGLDAASRRGCTFDADDEITGGDCVAKGAGDHELAGGPLADYGVSGADSSFLGRGLSGAIGVLLTFAVGAGLFWLIRCRGISDADEPTDATATAADRTG